MIAAEGLDVREMLGEILKFCCLGHLGLVGGDLVQRRLAHQISEAVRENCDIIILDERRRGDGRLRQRLTSGCVDILLAVCEEQQDLSRSGPATLEDLRRGFEAVGDRGIAVRRHLVDSRVDRGRIVRPWHARRRIRREGHHREARRICAEGVLAHQLLGEGLQPLHVRCHRIALVEHQGEVNLPRAGRRGRRRRQRGRRVRRRGWRLWRFWRGRRRRGRRW